MRCDSTPSTFPGTSASSTTERSVTIGTREVRANLSRTGWIAGAVGSDDGAIKTT